MPAKLYPTLENILYEFTRSKTTIHEHKSVSGGSINNCFKLVTNVGLFFLKMNQADKYPGMFEAEIKGLELLIATEALTIPEVIEVGVFENKSFLLMKFMDSGQTTSDFWTIFGTQLAAMHQQTNESFGLNHANYIGSLKQVNNQHSDWVSFFIEERLEFQLRMARDNGEIGSDFSRIGFKYLFIFF